MNSLTLRTKSCVRSIEHWLSRRLGHSSVTLAFRAMPWLQTARASLDAHDAHYRIEKALDEERQYIQRQWGLDAQNAPGFALGPLVEHHPGVRALAVDIGAGTGWVAGWLARQFELVHAIEPSRAAVTIAKRILAASNIEWHVGMAEDMLARLTLPSPALFVTGCVLSHLRDSETRTICRLVSQKAPRGSLLCFAECWGEEHHQPIWHVRSQDWWRSALPGWQLEFLSCNIEVPGRYKGIHGVKSS